MTVNKMNAWVHESTGRRIQIASYEPLLTAIRTELFDDNVTGSFLWFDFDLTDIAIGVVTAMLSGGIEREGMFGLTKFIHPATITFRKIIENGMNDPQGATVANMIIMDEEPIYKKQTPIPLIINCLKIDFQAQSSKDYTTS